MQSVWPDNLSVLFRSTYPPSHCASLENFARPSFSAAPQALHPTRAAPSLTVPGPDRRDLGPGRGHAPGQIDQRLEFLLRDGGDPGGLLRLTG